MSELLFFSSGLAIDGTCTVQRAYWKLPPSLKKRQLGGRYQVLAGYDLGTLREVVAGGYGAFQDSGCPQGLNPIQLN